MNLIETELGLELPPQFEKYDILTQQSVITYIKQLNSIERLA